MDLNWPGTPNRRGPASNPQLMDAEDGGAVRIWQMAFAGVPSGRLVEIRMSALVNDARNAQAPTRSASRESRLEAVRQALPGAVQVSDRWHLWHGLGEAVRKEVAAHSACWARAGPLQSGKRARTTLERWQQVHDLLGKGVGLLDCSRRLDLALNTVKRYARADRPERLQRTPQYRPTLVDPYRDHLRRRRAEDPAVPVQQLLREIRELGYQGSSNLLVRYINQGRTEGGRPRLSPRQAARILLTRPDRLTAGQAQTLADIEAACPEMTALASLVRSFAALLTPDPGNDGKLRQWITDARRRPAPRPLIHPRPRPGHPGGNGSAHTAAPQRPHRGRQHQDQDDQAADVRTRQLHPATAPHPPELRPRNVTTESATEPGFGRHPATFYIASLPFQDTQQNGGSRASETGLPSEVNPRSVTSWPSKWTLW